MQLKLVDLLSLFWDEDEEKLLSESRCFHVTKRPELTLFFNTILFIRPRNMRDSQTIISSSASITWAYQFSFNSPFFPSREQPPSRFHSETAATNFPWKSSYALSFNWFIDIFIPVNLSNNIASIIFSTFTWATRLSSHSFLQETHWYRHHHGNDASFSRMNNQRFHDTLSFVSQVLCCERWGGLT